MVTPRDRGDVDGKVAHHPFDQVGPQAIVVRQHDSL